MKLETGTKFMCGYKNDVSMIAITNVIVYTRAMEVAVKFNHLEKSYTMKPKNFCKYLEKNEARMI